MDAIPLMAPLTMENTADAVLAEHLASRAELDRLIDELYEFARDPDTVVAGPRAVEAWGYRPRSGTQNLHMDFGFMRLFEYV